jgi:NAD(P)H-hydrate repair Nnr-like enzyme with NAD(P)H-hydrate dehydratase domain
VWLHASAGDRAAGEGEIGTLATDLLPWIRAGRNGVDPCRD